MDGLTWFFIIFFGIAALIPAVWSIIGLIGGNPKFWPGVFGVVCAAGFLTVTFIGIGTKWGGCPPGSETAEGSVSCFKKLGDKEPVCEPDIWGLECSGKRPTCGKPPVAVPQGAFCPTGEVVIFPFCENIESVAPNKPNGVKQPWATWSDLSFVAAGLWLLWFFSYYERSEDTRAAGTITDNPMLMVGGLSVVYAVIVIFMGPASQWYHASMKQWGGWFDTMSVVLWLGFNAVYVSYALFRTMWGDGRRTERTILVLVFWFVLAFICGILAAKGLSLATYFISGGLWGLAEFAYLIVGRCKKDDVQFRRKPWLFWCNLGLLALTMGIWVAFNPSIVHTGCHSYSGFPGHALFHILASFSTIVTFISFASERPYTKPAS